VSKLADIQRLFDTAVEEFGKVDVLVNNAGVYEFRPLATVDENHFDRRKDSGELDSSRGDRDGRLRCDGRVGRNEAERDFANATRQDWRASRYRQRSCFSGIRRRRLDHGPDDSGVGRLSLIKSQPRNFPGAGGEQISTAWFGRKFLPKER
jgi:hypothetical protein